MKNKKIRLVISVMLTILACAAVFYALCIMEEILTPKKVCITLQDAIDSNKEFAGYTEILTQSETNEYTFVIVKVPGKKATLNIKMGAFSKTDQGWIVPAKVVFPISNRAADVGDSFCFITVYRISGSSGYCINIRMPEESSGVPRFTDSMNSDFGVYSYQSVPSIGYDAWAILPELPDDYTVYVNQEPVVIK